MPLSLSRSSSVQVGTGWVTVFSQRPRMLRLVLTMPHQELKPWNSASRRFSFACDSMAASLFPAAA